MTTTTTRCSTRRALLLCVVLLCALACIATAATATTAPPTQTPLAPAASLRTLRQEKDRGKPQQLKQQPDADEGGDEDADDQLLSATNNKQQAVLEKPLEKSTSRPITRVYDPVTGLFCELEGDCHACPVSEKDEVYCRETGNRQEMRCPRSPDATNRATTSPLSDSDNRLPEIRFKACVPLGRANPFVSVLLFEMLMAVAFAATFVLLRKEQQKHLSSFDLRKDPRQRTTLLGSSGSSSGQKGAD